MQQKVLHQHLGKLETRNINLENQVAHLQHQLLQRTLVVTGSSEYLDKIKAELVVSRELQRKAEMKAEDWRIKAQGLSFGIQELEEELKRVKAENALLHGSEERVNKTYSEKSRPLMPLRLFICFLQQYFNRRTQN